MPVSQAVELLQQPIPASLANQKKTANARMNQESRLQSSKRRSQPIKPLVTKAVLEKRNVAVDDEKLGLIANLIQKHITPMVAIETLDEKPWGGRERHQRESLLCDITGVAHLYDGEAGLCEATYQLLASYGLHCRMAVADSSAAAWAMAHYGWANSQRPICIVSGWLELNELKCLPIESLRIFPEVIRNLKRLGVNFIGELLTLPRSGLVSRLGKQLVRQLTRLLNEVEEPLAIHCPADDNGVALILEYPTRDQELLEDRARRLVERLCKRLVDSQQGILCLQMQMDQVEHPPCVLEVGVFAPTLDPVQLAGLVNQQLESHSLRGMVERITLRATLTGSLRTVQNALFLDDNSQDLSQTLSGSDLSRMVNLLSGRLGKDAVMAVQATKNPLPESAYKIDVLAGKRRDGGFKELNSKQYSARSTRNSSQPAASLCGGKSWGEANNNLRTRESRSSAKGACRWNPSPDDPMRRPASLLNQPIPLLVAFGSGGFWREVRTSDLPVRLKLAGMNYSIVASWGPERIETGWWKGPSIRRDYYRVELEDGQWWWIFRTLQSVTTGNLQSCWMLHGYFD